MAMRERALDDQGLLRVHHGLVLEHSPQRFDARLRPVGEVSQRALKHFIALAPALAQQHGGARVAVRNDFNIHGNMLARVCSNIKIYTWEHIARRKNASALTN